MKKLYLFFVAICLLTLPALAQVSSAKSNAGKITFKPQQTGNIKELPDLIIKEEKFIDENDNKIINAGEKCSISFKVENIGKGTAQNVKVRVSIKTDVDGSITFDEVQDLGDLPGETENEVVVPVQAQINTENGYAEFVVKVVEARGFDAFPLEMKIETQHFAKPQVVVADAVFSTDDGGNIKLNFPINLKMLVQNIGAGGAKDVKVNPEFAEPNCVFLGETDHYDLGWLASGETREIDFLFTATRRYTNNTIPIRVKISESYGEYANDTLLTVSLQENLIAKNQVVITGIPTAPADIAIASLTSDVDKNIPVCFINKPFRYALVIGNEDYQRYQRGLSSEANVEFARNDASVFRDYAHSVLGVEEKNIFFLTDATAGEMVQKIDLIAKLASKTSAEAEIIFYYAGHGLPDESTKEPYIIPVDVSATNLNAAIKLADVYKMFSETGARRILVFLDACFSGGGRDAGLLAARSVKVKPRNEMIDGNMVVFAASSGEQSSLPYKEKQHGMFTYFLLKYLQETKGNVTLSDLADDVKNKVSLESLRVNSKEQDPTVQVSHSVADKWEGWRINDK
jgi:hypothetical protein